MTALPPEERPPGRPDPSEPTSGAPSSGLPSGLPTGLPPGARPVPADEVLELLAGVVAFQASLEAHELRRPTRRHAWQARRWRREHEVLLLQRQMLRLRVEALPKAAFAPFPRPCL